MPAPERVPTHAIYVRWGNFRLNIIGRGPILCWLAVLASLVGMRALL